MNFDSLFGTFHKVSPPLNSDEKRAISLLCSLQDADLKHRCQGIPKWRTLWQLFLCSFFWPFYSRPDWFNLVVTRMEQAGVTKFRMRPPLSLNELWPRIAESKRFTPLKIDAETLWFDDFMVSRRTDTLLKSGTWTADYFVVAPTSKVSFRCIARDSSGRFFRTISPQSDCQPPEEDDFDIVRVKGLGFDDAGRVTIPCVMKIYLPECYGPWELLRTKVFSHNAKEKVLHDEDDADHQLPISA